MPRKGKGSKALDAPTTVESQLNSLTPANPEPKQEYGAAAEQRRGIQAIAAAQPPPQMLQPRPGEPALPQQPMREAGSLPWNEGPPDAQPMTHGAPFGAGAGAEALAPVGQQWNHDLSVSEALISMAQMPGASQEVKELAAFAAQIGRG